MKPTKQQRDIKTTLGTTLQPFRPGESSLARGARDDVLHRKRNPKALILSVDRIRVDEDQVRKQDKTPESPRIQELAKSIEQHGLQQPIGVRQQEDGTYTIVFGEGRFVATAKVLHWREIAATLVDASEEDILWIQLHENVHRRDLHPFDLADAVRRARESGHSVQDIGKRMCKNRTWVQKAMAIASGLSEEARENLADSLQGQSIEMVYAVATVQEERQADLSRRIVDEDMTKQDVLRAAAELKRGSTPSKDGRKRSRGKAKPFEKTIRVSKGVSVTVKFRKSQASDEEVTAAIEKALESLRPRRARAA